MADTAQEKASKYSSNNFSLNDLIERFEETKQLLVKWLEEMDKIIRGARSSIDEFKEALDTLARRTNEWRSILEKGIQGSEKEEKLSTPVRTLADEDMNQETEEESSSDSAVDLTYEDREDIKSYVLALKHGGWNRNKIVEYLSKMELHGAKVDSKVLNEITDDVFDQDQHPPLL